MVGLAQLHWIGLIVSGWLVASGLGVPQAAASSGSTATPLAQATSNVSASGGDENFIPGAPNGTIYGTAIVVGNQGESHFECWSFPLQASGSTPSANTYAFLLGDLIGTNYNVQDEGTAGATFHLDAVAQWTIYLSGGAFYALPNSTQTFTAVVGDMVLALDTMSAGARYGHETNYSASTVNLAAPFSNGVIPTHGVISDSLPCNHTTPPYVLPSNSTSR